ncbi:hypothetical protein [Microvirus mar62]|uniref:Uncharacterized protein n=1 Tax=Microvirus mar62 TaxID=2851199 RepID=A0A8F5ML98_9VIRU|nr:hypothetical protein [Microvirus mar62]
MKHQLPIRYNLLRATFLHGAKFIRRSFRKASVCEVSYVCDVLCKVNGWSLIDISIINR